jgi:hypothetical protein
MNQTPAAAVARRCVPVEDGDRGRKMIEFKIALMVVMIAILLFAVYFTAIPG